MKEPVTIVKTSKGTSKFDNEYFEINLTKQIYERSEVRHIIEILDKNCNL